MSITATREPTPGIDGCWCRALGTQMLEADSNSGWPGKSASAPRPNKNHQFPRPARLCAAYRPAPSSRHYRGFAARPRQSLCSTSGHQRGRTRVVPAKAPSNANSPGGPEAEVRDLIPSSWSRAPGPGAIGLGPAAPLWKALIWTPPACAPTSIPVDWVLLRDPPAP